jgi:hypothetical protein
MPDMTELLNSTSPMAMIRPTELERLHGRLMRAPDHPGGDGGDAGSDAGGGGGDADGAAGDQAGADQGGDAGDPAGQGGDGDEADAATLVGSATTGTGKDGEGDAGDPGEADAKDGAKSADEGPPEAYELKLVVKDGDTETEVEMDPVLVDAATPVLKEIGLSNDQANALLPLVPTIQAKVLQDQADTFETVSAGWAKAAKADKKLGGKNWAETEHLMAKAMDNFADDEFRSILNDSRLGNHPAFVRFTRAVGARLGEDGDFPRGDARAKAIPKEEIMYPNDVPQKKEGTA